MYAAMVEHLTREQRAAFDSELHAPLNPAVRAGMEKLHAALGSL